MKGLSHVGVARALAERELRPAGIVGTSIGALIGVLMATGMSWEEMAEHARAVTRADIVDRHGIHVPVGDHSWITA